MNTTTPTADESTDTKDAFARELGYDSLADAPPQARRNIEACWPNVSVGSFASLVDDLADSLEDA